MKTGTGKELWLSKRGQGNQKILLALAGVTAVNPTTKAAAQWNDRDDDKWTLEGTWITQVTLENCQTHMAMGDPFISMGSFATERRLLRPRQALKTHCYRGRA
jgi:hypothetical protein